MGLPEMLAALRERDFRLLFGAQAISVVGDGLVPVALAFAVLDLGGSPTELGLVLMARVLPYLAFVLVGGVWADRVPRERLMVLSHLIRFGSQAVLGLLLVSGTAQIWEIVVLMAVHGAATAFFRPATTGLVPQIVSAERLQQANALLFMTLSIGQIAGPALAGLLVVTVGSGWAILLDAFTFLVGAGLIAQIRPLGFAPPERERFIRELAAGWREVRSRDWLWISITDFAVFQLLYLATLSVLGPVVADDSLGGAAAWAVIVSSFGLGTVLGNMLALRWRPARPLVVCYLIMLAAAPPLVLLALAAPVPLIALAELVAGVAVALGSAVWETTMQERVPRHALSRVAAYDWMGSSVLRPVGLGLVGPVAHAIGIETTLLAAAAIIVVTNLGMLGVRSIREVRRDDLAEVPTPG
jgi:MFS family permease